MARYTLLLAVLGASCSVIYGQSIDTAECGVSVGCFRVPGGCSGSACDYIFTYAANGNNVDIQLSGKSDGWVAIGFSKDQTMGDDSVTECRQNGATVDVLQSYNQPQKGSTEDLVQSGLSNIEVSSTNGVITCSFSRTIANAEAKIFDLNAEYYLFLGVGPLAADGRKSFHTTIPSISGTVVDVTQVVPSGFVTQGIDGDTTNPSISDITTQGVPAGSTSVMLRAHGILMMSAWTIFVCNVLA